MQLIFSWLSFLEEFAFFQFLSLGSQLHLYLKITFVQLAIKLEKIKSIPYLLGYYRFFGVPRLSFSQKPKSEDDHFRDAVSLHQMLFGKKSSINHSSGETHVQHLRYGRLLLQSTQITFSLSGLCKYEVCDHKLLA